MWLPFCWIWVRQERSPRKKQICSKVILKFSCCSPKVFRGWKKNCWIALCSQTITFVVWRSQSLKTNLVGFSGQLWFLAASTAARMRWRCYWRAALMSKLLTLWVMMHFIMLASARTKNLLQLSKPTWIKSPEVSLSTFKSVSVVVCTCWFPRL